MKPTPKEIETWVPRHLGEVVGCYNLKEHLLDCLRLDGEGANTFVSGPTGTGKSACIKAYLRNLMCPHRAEETQEPCLRCRECKSYDVRESDEGIYAVLRTRVGFGKVPVNYFPINCGKVTESELRSILDAKRQYVGRFIIYLDEVHRLVKRSMQHMLLIPIQEDDATWIASTAEPEGLDQMFLRRFSVREKTQSPDPEEFETFLAQRCSEWEIETEADALPMLARRSAFRVSEALCVMARAAGKKDSRITLELIRKHFD